MTALMFASGNGHTEVVDTLLQHGASVNLQDRVSILMLIGYNCDRVSGNQALVGEIIFELAMDI